MKTRSLLFTLLLLALGSNARIHRGWTYQQLTDEAALIVIATPSKVTITAERAPFPSVALIGEGVETTFEVLTVLKGDKKMKNVTLHHYKLSDFDRQNFDDGPFLVSFDPAKHKNYLLFLQNDTEGRFAAVSGHFDPYMSIKEVQ